MTSSDLGSTLQILSGIMNHNGKVSECLTAHWFDDGEDEFLRIGNTTLRL